MRQLARAAFRFGAALEPKASAGASARSVLDPRHLVRAGLLSARFGSELLDRLWRGPEVAIGHRELDNKVRAFHFFESVVSHLELAPGELAPAEAIQDARERLGHEQAVWATEGIGYELLERRRKAGHGASGLLGGPANGVPEGSWTVLHTGMGMALAEAWLEPLAGRASAAEIEARLAEHLRLCREAARAGYAELVFEPLGLVARLLRPELVPAIGERLESIGAPWSELFWHGVGRGLYFLPAHLSPRTSTPWAGLGRAREEPPHDVARRNALSGFAWAATLVNLRHPEVVESFLAHHVGNGETNDPAAQGVVSALLLWHETSHGSRELRRFVGHVAAPERRPLWRRVVSEPYAAGLQAWASPGAVEPPGRVTALFRYR